MIKIHGTYTSATVYSDTIDDSAYEQIQALCDQPMFRSSRIRIMPDCHAGKSCVIGFTAVSDERMIVPNMVGVDIGCGVLSTVFSADSPLDYKRIDDFIRESIPSGMKIREAVSPYVHDADGLMSVIASICHEIEAEDKKHTFLMSIGTLGGGNHFIEIDRIAENRYLLTVHTGSRGLGVHVCKYFQSKGSRVDEQRKRALIALHRTAVTAEEHRRIQEEIEALPIAAPDMAYITGDLYDRYIECMLRAEAYASANRSCISDTLMHFLQEAFGVHVEERFDTVHNYIDFYDSTHRSIIIRKGAINAEKGKRLCIPLNMRDGVIVGNGKGNPEWNHSAPHGAGRSMSRSEARHRLMLEDYEETMRGIHTWSLSDGTIDEAPQAYKPSEEILALITDTVEVAYVAETIYNFKAE